MAPTARLPPKKDVALALLEQASMYIHLDPRADEVQVPAWFKKQPQLVLQVGLNMAVPIPDLHVDERGLSCTLSFNRSPFLCMIPWRAVFALVGENGQAMVWAEDVPAEVAAQAQAQKAPEKPRAHLRSVADGESAAPDRPTAPKAAAKSAAPHAIDKKSPPKTTKAVKAPSKSKPVELASVAAKRAIKTAAKSKPAPHKSAPQKAAAPSKKVAERKPAKKPTPADATEKPARQQPVAATAKRPPEPVAASADREMGKPKRELPPYLRVVK